MPRNTFRFSSDDPPWTRAQEWARQERFKLLRADNVHRLYRRGIGVTSAPAFVEIIYATPWVYLQTWVNVNLIIRAATMFTTPNEMALDSNGRTLRRSRRLAATSVNILLAKLGLEEMI